jgi:hypothetical protein
LVSVPEQRMVVLDDERKPLASYPVSTSKFGLGDERGSYRTPLGRFEIAAKIGDRVPPGGVLKSRRYTGEVLPVDAPGRDPIVTRILWLKGKEAKNRNAYGRYIYIHGTPEERNIGRPVSFGCVRMRSDDVIDLYRRVGEGSEVVILNRRLPGTTKEILEPQPQPAPLSPDRVAEQAPLVAQQPAPAPKRSPLGPPHPQAQAAPPAAEAPQAQPELAALSPQHSRSPSWYLSLKEAAALLRR